MNEKSDLSFEELMATIQGSEEDTVKALIALMRRLIDNDRMLQMVVLKLAEEVALYRDAGNYEKAEMREFLAQQLIARRHQAKKDGVMFTQVFFATYAGHRTYRDQIKDAKKNA